MSISDTFEGENTMKQFSNMLLSVFQIWQSSIIRIDGGHINSNFIFSTACQEYTVSARIVRIILPNEMLMRVISKHTENKKWVLFVCLFVYLSGLSCGTRLGPGGPDSSKSSSQAKKPKHAGHDIKTDKNRLKKWTSWKKPFPTNQVNNFTVSL